MITFPIEMASVGFNALQPYLDIPFKSVIAQKIGTLFEYAPNKFGLVAGLKINNFPIRKIQDLYFTALNGSQRIELEPVIICAKTNLIILKPKDSKAFESYHADAVRLCDTFEVKDSEKLRLYQKDLRSLKEVITNVKAKRFRFERGFRFSLAQKIESENGLSSPGPLLNKEGKLVAYMIGVEDNFVVSAFHIRYMMKQLLTNNTGVFAHYPIIDFKLMNLTSDNYHLYLPQKDVDPNDIFYGCSIQDCPTYPRYPFKRGDVLIAINGNRIKNQHIEHPEFGAISIEAAPLLSETDKLLFTLYRDGRRCEIEVDKEVFSRSNQYMQNEPKFIILNGIIFQVANEHYYKNLTGQGNTPEREYLKPENNHSLGKGYAYRKDEDREIVLITETLTNDTLFSSAGNPLSVSTILPFVVKKLNGQPVRNLENLMQLMKTLPIGMHYDLEGTIKDQVTNAYGIKVSDVRNKEILASRAITNSSNLDMPEENNVAASTSVERSESAPVCLYRYENKQLSVSRLSSKSNLPNEFLIQTAAMRGVLFIHTTTKHRSATQPYQYSADTKGTGSGFIIQHAGKNYIITCAHVLGYTTQSQLKANFPGQSKDFELQILMLNNDQDIAILQVEPSLQAEFDNMAYPFCLDNAAIFPKKQSDISVIGFPGASAGEKTNPKIQTGKVTTIGYMPLQGQNGLVIQANAATSGGNSGGPVVDSHTGAVIGIHSNGSTVAQLTNFSRPIIFLIKMLKQLQQAKTPYPVLPGVPFELSLITDRKLKIAHGLEPDSPMGAKINALYGEISGVEVGDILLELIDKDQRIYPVDGKGNVSIEENDIAYRVFFELQEVNDPISIKVLRHGKEHIIHTRIDASWPLSAKICSKPKDSNDIPYLEFCKKLILTNFDENSTKTVTSKYSLLYYSGKMQKQVGYKRTKVVILQFLPGAYKELSSWIAVKDTKELLFLNKINGIPVHNLEDVRRIAETHDGSVFELECKSSQCNGMGEKFIFRITDDTKNDCRIISETEVAMDKMLLTP